MIFKSILISCSFYLALAGGFPKALVKSPNSAPGEVTELSDARGSKSSSLSRTGTVVAEVLPPRISLRKSCPLSADCWFDAGFAGELFCNS